jgi:hypothetical protein
MTYAICHVIGHGRAPSTALLLLRPAAAAAAAAAQCSNPPAYHPPATRHQPPARASTACQLPAVSDPPGVAQCGCLGLELLAALGLSVQLVSPLSLLAPQAASVDQLLARCCADEQAGCPLLSQQLSYTPGGTEGAGQGLLSCSP